MREAAPQRFGNGEIQIRITAYDEWRAAPQLEQGSLEALGSGLGDAFAGGDRAGESDQRYFRSFDEGRADLAIARQHIERARWQAGFFAGFDEQKGRQRCFLGWLDDERATCRQTGADLPGQEIHRKIPGDDGGDYPHGLLEDEAVGGALVASEVAATEAARFGGVEIQHIGGITTFLERIVEGFAIF